MELRANANAISAFTLIELLVVIAIIAILAVVVVLTLNPAQLLAQSRDANRVSDMATLNSALNIYTEDQSANLSLGTPSTTYVSLPSTAANCGTYGIAGSAFPYQCSTASEYRVASSSGWVPVNFNLISSGAPFGSVPVDPVNATSTDLYYTYGTNGTTYEVTAALESAKYAKEPQSDSGNDPVLLEAGTGAASLADAGRGLVLYWPFNEGAAGSVLDWSGFANSGTWNGAASGTSGYYAPGHAWPWAGYFNGATTYVTSTAAFPTSTSPASWAFWVDPSSVSNGSYGGGNGSAIIDANDDGGSSGYDITVQSNNELWFWPSGGNDRRSAGTIPLNAWTFVVCTYDGTDLRIYFNGVLDSTQAMTAPQVPAGFRVGHESWTGGYLAGSLGDLRIYDRVLGPAEVLQMYDAER